MTILFNNAGGETQSWLTALRALLPDQTIAQFPVDDPEQVRYAVVWNHPAGDLANYPNLKAILNLGAGTDYLEQDPNLPRVPIVRLLDPSVGANMSQYALYWVMHLQRDYPRYAEQQANKVWQRHRSPMPADYAVSVLGLGLIGTQVAECLRDAGFAVSGWSKSKKHLPGVSCHYGDDGLHQMLSATRVLINMLPHNDATEGLLNRETLSMLPRGAGIINLSRGAVINETDLIDLLNQNHLGLAVLDTVCEEPLPKDSPLWTHSRVIITPHMSGATYADTSAQVIADNIQRMERGETAFPIYPQFSY